MMVLRTRLRPLAVAAIAMTTALALAACGSSGETSGGGKTSTAAMAKFQKALDGYYAGVGSVPAGPAVKPPTGKTIWLVSGGLGVEYNVNVAAGVKAAAAKLGWNIHVFDSKFDPTQMLAGVQQAIAAKADGIILGAIDCDEVKNGLTQAKAAGIPVVGIESNDCSPSLEFNVTYNGHHDLEALDKMFGAAQATWVIVKTDGKAKVIMNTETDTQTTRWASDGIKEELAKCSGCSVVADASFVLADFGPTLQSKIQQALLQHPEANAFIPAYDATMTQSGGAQAIQASGRAGKLVVAGGEGTLAGIAQIRSGNGMQMCACEDPSWESYASVDAMIRLLLKQDPNATDTGIGLQVVDKDHNLPAAGKGYVAPIDFVGAYLKMWGLS